MKFQQKRNEWLPKRACFEQPQGGPQEGPQATPAVIRESSESRDPALERAELALRIQDAQFIGQIVETMDRNPDELSQEQKNAMKALIEVELAQRPAPAGTDFQAWTLTVANPHLRQILDAAARKNVSVLRLSGLQWQAAQSESSTLADMGNAILDSVKGAGQRGAQVFNEWAQEHPALAVAAMIGGAYACSKVITKVFGDGYIGKAIHLVGGAVVAGKALQLEGVKDWIKSTLGIQVEDWRLGRALQEMGSLEFGRAFTVVSGGDPNERSSGDLREAHESLERLIFEQEGFADIIFGRENLNWALQNTVLPALQSMEPPRISPSKKYEDLNTQEKKILLQYALQHSGMIPEREGNPSGKRYDQVRNKEKIQEMDVIFGELQKAKAAFQAKSNEEVLDMVKNEVSGMGDFSVFLNQINDEQRAEVAGKLKEQILGTFDGFMELKQMIDEWKTGEPPALPRGAAIQLIKLEELFGTYVGNIKELQDAEKIKKMIKIGVVATFVAGLGIVGTGVLIMKVAGTGIRILFGALRWGRVAARGGPLVVTAAIIIGAATTVYLEGGAERERRRSRNPEGWLEFAKTQVRNTEDAEEKLYELVYLQNDDRAWTFNAGVREFFVDARGSEILELRQCREFILKGAVLAELEKIPFPANTPREKIQLYKDRAFSFIDQEYRSLHYAPQRRAEAADWVRKALLYATLLDEIPAGTALQMAREGRRTPAQEELRKKRIQTSVENPTHALETPLQTLTTIDRRASLSLAADLYYLKEIRSDRNLSQKIPGYDPRKANSYDEAYRVATDHLELRGAEGEMLTRMTQGGYNQIRGMLEHTELITDPNKRWGTLPNAEAARLGVFLEMYDKYPQQREILGVASHTTQILKKMYFEGAPEGQKRPVGRYVLSPIDTVRMNSRISNYLEGVRAIWTVLPEFMERIKNIQDPRKKLTLSYHYFELVAAQQVADNGDKSVEKARALIDIALQETKVLPNVSEKKNNFTQEEAESLAYYAQSHLSALEGSQYEAQSRTLSITNGNQGEILVNSSGYQRSITFNQERNIYKLGNIEFEASTHGLIQAVMSVSKINYLVNKYKGTTFESDALKNKAYFYMNDWTGVYIAEEEALGSDDLVLPQDQLYYVTTGDKSQFISTLNEAMDAAR